ncbi:MAG: YitT family protein [Clostridiaceae bacterium]|nr:YitT family protein [Clostridiaceae bacterium]
MSEKSEQIADAIIHTLGRGVTGFAGRGMYFKRERETLFCVVKNRQLPALKKLVKQMDNKAFLIVTSAHQVLGEGFGAFDKEL